MALRKLDDMMRNELELQAIRAQRDLELRKCPNVDHLENYIILSLYDIFILKTAKQTMSEVAQYQMLVRVLKPYEKDAVTGFVTAAAAKKQPILTLFALIAKLSPYLSAPSPNSKG